MGGVPYGTQYVERVVELESTSSAWKAEAQPLYHTRVERHIGNDPIPEPWQGSMLPLHQCRVLEMAGTVGLEPTTIRLTAERSAIELHPNKKIYRPLPKVATLDGLTACGYTLHVSVGKDGGAW